MTWKGLPPPRSQRQPRRLPRSTRRCSAPWYRSSRRRNSRSSGAGAPGSTALWRLMSTRVVAPGRPITGASREWAAASGTKKKRRLTAALDSAPSDGNAGATDEQMLMLCRRHSTCSRMSRPSASSSRVVTKGGSRRTVQSPAVQVRSPSSRAASTTCDAVPMMSIPHM